MSSGGSGNNVRSTPGAWVVLGRASESAPPLPWGCTPDQVLLDLQSSVASAVGRDVATHLVVVVAAESPVVEGVEPLGQVATAVALRGLVRTATGD